VYLSRDLYLPYSERVYGHHSAIDVVFFLCAQAWCSMMPEDRVRVSPQKRYVDQGLEDLPLKRPKLVVSEEQSFDNTSTVTLPPRLRNFQRRQEGNRKQRTLEGSVVSLSLVTRFITEDDICEMLLEMGIKTDASVCLYALSPDDAQFM